MTTTEKPKKTKKKVPMDERAVRSLAALLDGTPSEKLEEALLALVTGLKSRIYQEWHRRQAQKNISRLMRPIENAMAADCGPEEVAQAILADPDAVKIIQQLGSK